MQPGSTAGFPRTSLKSIFRATFLAAAAVLCAALVAPAQTVTTIYNFADNRASGANPWYVTLVQGTNGNLYGTTYNGGKDLFGTVFNVTDSGSQKIIYSFTGTATDGAFPTGGLTLGTDGNFYGTTQQGGTHQMGTAFKVTPTGTITILHNFNAFVDGAFPWGPPILASDGNFYGTTSGGGINGHGVVYKMTTAGTVNKIYQFDVTHGFSPIAPPTQGIDGFLYIPVSEGGTLYCGTILQMSTAGVINNTYDFPCGAGGSFPIGPLVQASNGNFYSTTQDGGTNGEGTIYQVTPGLAVTVLHSFGATFGDGTFPSAGLLLATDGNYYGASSDGGASGDGTLFNTSTSGTYTSLQLQQLRQLYPNVTACSSDSGDQWPALRRDRIRWSGQRRHRVQPEYGPCALREYGVVRSQRRRHDHDPGQSLDRHERSLVQRQRRQVQSALRHAPERDGSRGRDDWADPGRYSRRRVAEPEELRGEAVGGNRSTHSGAPH